MEVATLAVAAAGVALGALSLGWQAATFFLAGGRVKAELLVGGRQWNGPGIITMAAPSFGKEDAEELTRQGYGRKVVAVRVRNVGRLPVTVTDWSLVTSRLSMAVVPVGDSLFGPPLPHRLEGGESALWAVDRSVAGGLRQATADLLNVPAERATIRSRVGLGNGRTIKAKGQV